MTITNASNLLHRLGTAVLISATLAGSSLLLTTLPAAAADDANAVYIQTNDPTSNAIAIFSRAADGTLSPAGTVATGGKGTGKGLGSQGAVVLSPNNRWLFAVNAGSNEISSFAVKSNGLTLAKKVASGGAQPSSLTVHGDVLYVLNSGDPGNITGFHIGSRGELTALPGSTQWLSNNGVGAAPGPAQVQFSPSGDWLAVTEKASNQLLVFPVDDDGIASAAHVYHAPGITPFGFDFDKRGHVIVSEAFGGAMNASAVSSFNLFDAANVTVAHPSAPTQQTAACWLVVSKNGLYAYTTDAGSDVISGYKIGPDGNLAALNSNGITGVTGDNPTDIDFSKNSSYLYTLNTRAHSISVFRVGADGALSPLQELAGAPMTAAGLAAQ